MRRLSLSTKLLAAALPLVVAVGALLALTVRSDLNDVQRAESGAELGAVWNPLITALIAVESEVDVAGPMLSSATDGALPDAGALAVSRRATDQAVNDLRDAVETLGAAGAAGEHITAGRSALSAARRNLDMASLAPELQSELDPVDAYDLASREIVSVGQLLPSEAGEPELGRELLAVVKLAEAKLAANTVITNAERWQTNQADRTPLATARSAFSELEATLSEFEAIAPDDWAAQFRQSGFTSALAGFRGDLDRALRAIQAGTPASFDSVGFSALVDQGVQFQRAVSDSIVDRASTQVDETRQATLVRIGIILGAVLLAGLIAWAIIRSITKRVQAVSSGAKRVATEQLPALVEALRDPRGKAVLPEIEPVNARGGDELAELATAFNSMQGTLVDVAHQQVEVLRRGVSDIFVTMARRNRSLIDRQLAMLDEYEAEVDDPDVLSNYYQLDHLATRMRRNSESLLVLANAEPKRRRVKATEIDDVVRASIGEVEDYRRIEIEALESLQVRGNVVADISHLLAELLDNATSFSPPDSPVRVGGRRTGDSYMLRIVDDDVGIGTERLRELNALLREPPIVGLSVESTLGMSVVSLLANKYGIEVTLSAGNPGLTVDVVLPSALFGPIEVPFGSDMPATASIAAPTIAAESPVEQLVEPPVQQPAAPTFDGGVAAAAGATLQPVDVPVAEVPVASAPMAPVAAERSAPPIDPDDERRVVASDWSKMALDLAAFKSGQASVEQAQQAPTPVEPDVAVPATANQPPMPDLPAAPAAPPAHADNSLESLAAQVGAADPFAGQGRSADIGGEFSFDTTSTPAPPAALPDLPPPGLARRGSGEFDVPPAPPLTAAGPSRRPVSPDSARPAPVPQFGAAGSLDTSSLPTRSPGRDPGADHPDRLAGTAVSSTSEPSALSAALSAYDTGRNGAADGLPTRARVGDPIEMIEEPLPTAQSRLDPEALRQRLRAFQSEFTTGLDSETGGDKYDHDHTDLGGDRR